MVYKHYANKLCFTLYIICLFVHSVQGNYLKTEKKRKENVEQIHMLLFVYLN